MTAQLIIREADGKDTERLAELIRQSYRDVAQRFGLTAQNCPKHPSNCTTEWIERDFTRRVRYFLLEAQAVVAGCAALEMAKNGTCYLERLCVLPQHRRKGYGQRLAEYIFAEAKAAGAQRVGIGIIAEQSELKHWYQKFGFIEGQTKEFAHLPFRVAFLTREI